MEMISTRTLRDGLKYGRENGYVLFPEIRNPLNHKSIRDGSETQEMMMALREEAERILRSESPRITFSLFKEYEISGNRTIYERAFFQMRRQLEILMLLTVVDQTEAYIAAIQDKIWAWCDLYAWDLPAHLPMTVEAISVYKREADRIVAIVSSEMAFYFAELLSLIGEKLDPLVVYRLKKEIFRRVLDSFMERMYGWEGARNNWSAVCCGNVGSAALYLIEDEEILSSLLQRIIGAMGSYLEGFDRDGVTTEGLGYWQYGFSHFVIFAELLRERTCGQISLLEHDSKIRKIVEFPAYLQLSGGITINFSDAPLRSRLDHGLLARLYERFGVRGYSFADTRLSRMKTEDVGFAMADWDYRSLYWAVNVAIPDEQHIKTGSFFFPESQWVIDRSTDGDGRLAVFAAKGGHNDEPHNHNDIGHFILHYNGRNVLYDLGTPEYTKDYFRKKRYDNLNASSLGHSVPVINGAAQCAGRQYCARVLDYKEENGQVFYSLDMKAAYAPEELEVFERVFVWDYRKLQLDIMDVFAFHKPGNRVEEVFITQDTPEVLCPGLVKIHAGVCAAELLYDASLECRIIRESYRERDGKDASAYRICLGSSMVGTGICHKITIRLIPS